VDCGVILWSDNATGEEHIWCVGFVLPNSLPIFITEIIQRYAFCISTKNIIKSHPCTIVSGQGFTRFTGYVLQDRAKTDISVGDGAATEKTKQNKNEGDNMTMMLSLLIKTHTHTHLHRQLT
jgi:prolyl-tRNA synthetase